MVGLACGARPTSIYWLLPPTLHCNAETGDRPGLETDLPEAAKEEIKNADKGQVGSQRAGRCVATRLHAVGLGIANVHMACGAPLSS